MRRADRLFHRAPHAPAQADDRAAARGEREISERTVYRDVADLVGSGVPIRGEAGVGHALERGFDLPPLMFTEDAAWCELRQGFRGFRLDRVQTLELTEQRFEDEPGRTLAELFDHIRPREGHMTMKLGYTIVYVPDVKRTAEFWERAFGVVQRSKDEHPLYREMETGGHTLAFAAQSYVKDMLPGGFRPAQNDEAPPPFEVALTTDDVAGALERAMAAGARKVLAPTKKPWGQTVAYVRDCDGTLVELCTPMA